MTGETAELRLIGPGGGDEIEHYPFAPDLRLETHGFFTFFHRRFLNSRFVLLASEAVQCYGVRLFAISRDQTPVGTLPIDGAEIAELLRIDLSRFNRLKEERIGLLYKWTPCRVDDEIRLMHPVMNEVTEEALRHQKKAAARSEAGNRRKRLNRLKAQVASLGNSRMAADDALIEWLDEWLEDRCEGNRTATWTKRGLEAHSASEFS